MKRGFPALVLCIALCGCAARTKTVTNLPAGVTVQQVQSWDSAVADLDKFATAVSGVRQTVISLNQQGVFPDGPEYVATLNGIGKAAQLEVEAATFLKGVPNDWTQPTQQKFASYVAQIATSLNGIVKDGVPGIKNATSQQQVTQLVTNAAAIVGIVISLT